MNERSFKFLFLPILLSVIIIIVVLKFNLAIQTITIVGSIFSAFVAIYIAETNRYNDREAKNKNKIMLIKYSLSLVPKISKDLASEIENYKIYANEIRNKGMDNVALKSVSFYYLKEFDKIDKNELFNAISSISNNKLRGITDSYLLLLSYINSAIYVQDTVIGQSLRFIESQNSQSATILYSMEKLNKLYLEEKRSPSSKLVGFCDIIDIWNNGINSDKINYHSFIDFRNQFIDPLARYNVSGNMQFIKNWKKIQIAIDKFENLRNLESNYFSSLSDELGTLNSKIIEKEKELKELLIDID